MVTRALSKDFGSEVAERRGRKGVLRLRPILMTTLTVLVSATVLTLHVVPALFYTEVMRIPINSVKWYGATRERG